MDKSKIASAFGKAAHTYEEDAPVQRWTAQQVIGSVPWESLPDNAKVLEIGCGTGFLTELLKNKISAQNLTVTDLSPQMLAKCRAKIGEGPTYQVLDGEHPDIESSFDLIVSSLAVQWFADLAQGLSRLVNLLSPNGVLVFSTLGARSFEEWKDICAGLGLPVGMHPYPSFEDAGNYQFENATFRLTEIDRVQNYRNGYDFLRALKAIGAERPVEGYAPIAPGALRKAIRGLNDGHLGECPITYHLLLGVIRKEK